MLLDTNVYGSFLEQEGNEDIAVKIEQLKKEGRLVIHNFRVIRDEIRDAKSMEMLELYDRITANTIHVLDNKIEELAELYFKAYAEKGGTQKKTQNFMNDMRIVAFATLKGLDVVCSDDNKAFHSKIAQDGYREVNARFIYRGPYFFTLKELKKAWFST